MIDSKSEIIVRFVDYIFFSENGKHLDTLQEEIIRGVLSQKKYLKIANDYGYSLSHIKETAAEIWKTLSDALGETVNKRNLEAAVSRYSYSSSGKNAIYINQVSNFIANSNSITFPEQMNERSSAHQSTQDLNLDSLIARMKNEGLSDEQIDRILGNSDS
jgi:hypothetical protein